MMSVQALWEGLRWPTGQDLLFSVKAMAAVAISLAIGFSQDLENPYWSALTVYILVAQPQTGAIRSKALYRLGGTVLGGVLTIGAAALLASHLGVLIITLLAMVVATLYLKLLDRTPANYFWFATSLTIAIIGVVHAQAPETIWTYGVTRMGEIGLAILSIGFVDSLVAPRAITPVFVKAMDAWRGEAGDWATAALASDAADDTDARTKRRAGLRAIAAKAAPLDAQGVQLPWDVVPRPPSARAVRLLRLLVARLMAELASANVWLESVREHAGGTPPHDEQLAAVRDWLAERPALEPDAVAEHTARAEHLIRALDEARDDDLDGPPDTMLAGTTLLRLRELVADWSAMEQVLAAIAAGRPLPPALARAADRAHPLRSVDYLASAIDMIPLALGFTLITTIWFWTAWTGASTALLFVYVAAAFILGTPGVVASARGETLWLAIAFGFTFLYQFVILPRVTEFPVLIAVLACALVPLGLVMAMAPAGLLIAATTFGFLGLQNAYSADFGSSLQSLAGAMTGCMTTIGMLHLCRYDEPRFRARRLRRAMWRDVAEAVSARPAPRRDRYVSLGVDRLSMYLQATASLPDDDPLRRPGLIACLRTGGNLLALRGCERDLAGDAGAAVRAVRRAVTAPARRGAAPDGAAVRPLVEQAFAQVHAQQPGPARTQALGALTGLRLAFAPEGSAR